MQTEGLHPSNAFGAILEMETGNSISVTFIIPLIASLAISVIPLDTNTLLMAFLSSIEAGSSVTAPLPAINKVPSCARYAMLSTPHEPTATIEI